MRLTRDPFCTQVYDAFMNAIVACFIGGILGADLVVLIFAESAQRLHGLMPTLEGAAIVLMILICYLCNNIRKSLDKK